MIQVSCAVGVWCHTHLRNHYNADIFPKWLRGEVLSLAGGGLQAFELWCATRQAVKRYLAWHLSNQQGFCPGDAALSQLARISVQWNAGRVGTHSARLVPPFRRDIYASPFREGPRPCGL